MKMKHNTRNTIIDVTTEYLLNHVFIVHRGGGFDFFERALFAIRKFLSRCLHKNVKEY